MNAKSTVGVLLPNSAALLQHNKKVLEHKKQQLAASGLQASGFNIVEPQEHELTHMQLAPTGYIPPDLAVLQGGIDVMEEGYSQLYTDDLGTAVPNIEVAKAAKSKDPLQELGNEGALDLLEHLLL